MSVRVNLLPGEVQQRSEATRSRVLAALAGLVVIVVLAGLTLLQRGEIAEAQDQLAVVQATNQQLQADIAALQPFADLEARAQSSVETVELALGDEGSLATVLQDLSAVLPPNAQIDTLAIALSGDAQAPSPGGDRLIVGRIQASGKVLEGVAPGVERLVIDLDRVAAFDNAYVTTSVIDDEGVATFTLEIELGPEVLTGRYDIEGTEAGS